jgi:CheY-like chemotaxis protein
MNASGAVLLVEDDATDVFLMERAFKQTEIIQPLFVAKDGIEAVDFLTKAHASTDLDKYPMPRLILLDLKLPLKSGLEVLKWIFLATIMCMGLEPRLPNPGSSTAAMRLLSRCTRSLRVAQSSV